MDAQTPEEDVSVVGQCRVVVAPTLHLDYLLAQRVSEGNAVV